MKSDYKKSFEEFSKKYEQEIAIKELILHVFIAVLAVICIYVNNIYSLDFICYVLLLTLIGCTSVINNKMLKELRMEKTYNERMKRTDE